MTNQQDYESGVARIVSALRHRSTLDLMAYRESLRNRKLSHPRMLRETDEKLIVPTTKIWDLSCPSFYEIVGTHEQAINHHIATNYVLRERNVNT